MRLLYLSCHSVLEYDEVKLFHEIGIDVFSPGAYVEPANPGDSTLRPSIPGLEYNPEEVALWHALGKEGRDNKDCLTKEFVDRFDAVMIMHYPGWIHSNWEVMKHKKVIWRTIGQSVQKVEEDLKPYRDQGMMIVRYSPLEKVIPSYLGEDAIIRFYKDPNDFGDWVGNEIKVITAAQNMRKRAKFMGYHHFMAATDDLERRIFGPHDIDAPTGVPGGRLSFEELQKELKVSRVYFYTGTAPASYTLNFIEAWMTGIPVVALGRELGIIPDFKEIPTYEVDRLIDNGVTGFTANTVSELHDRVQMLFDDWDLAKEISKAGRKRAIEIFGKAEIKSQWEDFFRRLQNDNNL